MSEDDGKFELAERKIEKRNIAEVDSIMFSMDGKLKNKERTHYQNEISSGGCRVILPTLGAEEKS